MIEIAPEKYWKWLTLSEAMMYCFSLSIGGKAGWRLPTLEESRENTPIVKCLEPNWNVGDVEKRDHWEDDQWWAIPVRDLKDD